MTNNEDSNNSPFAFCKVNIRTERNITGYLQADRNCNVQFYHAEQSSALSTFGWIDINVDNERSNEKRRHKIYTIVKLRRRSGKDRQRIAPKAKGLKA